MTDEFPHWWMRPHTLQSVRETLAYVIEAHRSGQNMPSIMMNRIEIALEELERRMAAEEGTSAG
jgi:hypothetical protein